MARTRTSTRFRARWAAFAMLFLSAAILTMPASAAKLAADLSRSVVSITTGFVGSNVILFGAADGPGDIVVVVEGPGRDTVVRRKSRVSGIWINRQSVVFRNAPSFYAVAASGPLDKIVSARTAKQFRIGAENLELKADGIVSEGQANRFREALIRNQRRAGLFPKDVSKVVLPSKGVRLFRTEVFFPSNVPTGTYNVRFMLLRDGFVIQQYTRKLVVDKAGMSARVFQFAHEQSILYGIMAILLAVAAGWAASAVFGRK